MSTKGKHCWNCNGVCDPAWVYCPACGKTLRNLAESLPPDRERDIDFLYDTYSFGWYNHHVGAVGLHDCVVGIKRFYEEVVPEEYRFEVEENVAQEFFRAKLFMELVALLEVFGYLCLAIRGRHKQSMLWTYLHTEPQSVKQFYKEIKLELHKSKKIPDLQSLLKLPQQSRLRQAARKQSTVVLPRGKSIPALKLVDSILQNYEAQGAKLLTAAVLYLDEDMQYTDTYNRLKHVFPVVNGTDIAGRSWLDKAVESPSVSVLMEATGRIRPLAMTQEDAETEIQLIHTFTLLGAEFMALCIGLYQMNMLW